MCTEVEFLDAARDFDHRTAAEQKARRIDAMCVDNRPKLGVLEQMITDTQAFMDFCNSRRAQAKHRERPQHVETTAKTQVKFLAPELRIMAPGEYFLPDLPFSLSARVPRSFRSRKPAQSESERCSQRTHNAQV